MFSARSVPILSSSMSASYSFSDFTYTSDTAVAVLSSSTALPLFTYPYFATTARSA